MKAIGMASLTLVLCACNPPPPQTSPPASPPEGAGAAEVQAPFFSDRIVDAWLRHDPAWGRQVGLHQHDGRVADYSAEGREALIAFLARTRGELAAVDPASLAPDAALDLAILNNRAALAHFDLAERRLHRKNPRHYAELFDVSSYIDFDYAPLAERARRLVAHQEAALAQTKHVLGNLDPVLSRPVVETAVQVFRGYADYLRGDVVKVLEEVEDSDLERRFAESNTLLAAEASAIADALESKWLPRADEDSHVLGEERYLAFVAAQEGRHYSLETLREMAETDLARNKRAYQALRSEVTIQRPAKEELLEAARSLVESSRAFVVDRKLATIPSDARCEVRETPPYMRWNAAFLNMTGPFADTERAFYYITLPNPDWPEDEQQAYVFPWGVLQSTTVHEVYPGHFLHGLWITRAPTRVQKMVASYSFTEGWAHYTEQLMIEEGFEDQPPRRLGQLSDALLRNCRFVVSIEMHAGGMSLKEAQRRFEEDCFQDAASARQQAVRATFDPGYFAYTLGKLQILELREALKRELGDAFSLRAFHDALLAHGAPPVALIGERVRQALRP